MNQFYAEAGVKRKPGAGTMGLKLLMGLAILAGLFIMSLGSVLSIVGAALIVGSFYFFPKLNIEYEYVFVDGQLDFDKIYGKAKRRTLLRIDFEQVEIMAPSTSHELDSYNQIKCEEKDFTSGDKDKKFYVIIAHAAEKKLKISFEPSEKMIAMIKQKSPRKVVLY